MLDAQIYMGYLSLSFYRDLQHASVGIENFGVAGVDTFANDTLLDVKRMYVVLNIASLFSDSYEINKVELIDATAKAKVLENGKANWDILGSLSDTTETVEEDTSAASPFGLSLESVKVENLNVLSGEFINMEYTLPNGEKVKFLDDKQTYLGSQLESEFGGRCFGIAANMDFLLVCTYEENGENPELVIYKKR